MGKLPAELASEASWNLNIPFLVKDMLWFQLGSEAGIVEDITDNGQAT